MHSPPPQPLPENRHIRHYLRASAWCEWDEHDQWADRVRDDVARDDRAPWPPFLLLGMAGIDAATQRACAHRWLRDRLRDAVPEVLAPPPEVSVRACGSPLKIGYLSGDFQQHATALLMIETLEAHDARRTELHAYSHGADDGMGMRERLVAAFHRFTDIRGMSDLEVAAAIRADGIHILVDLKGYTAGSRSILLAHRAAPVQVSFLGYPGTMGRGFVDYLISDRFVTPHSASDDYEEALACLPHSYQPHARVPLPAPVSRTTRRDACDLPEGAVVFGCFNQPWKITPPVFDVWCALLRAVPGSVLWLLDDPHARGNLRNEALARGVEPQRLVFAPDRSQADHLARLPLMDLMLDTWPYNGHTTASDALAAGVPVVTCAGITFASRVAGSLLTAVGLPELVTSDAAAYAAVALGLAADERARAALRARLDAMRHTAPLFDVPAYTLALHALFDAMWARYASGHAPIAIDLEGFAPHPLAVLSMPSAR